MCIRYCIVISGMRRQEMPDVNCNCNCDSRPSTHMCLAAGILELEDSKAADDDPHDEVLAELRKKQAELRVVSNTNYQVTALQSRPHLKHSHLGIQNNFPFPICNII